MISALLLLPGLAAARPTGATAVLEALAHVAPADRLRLAGAGLDELSGWKYGTDLAPVFRAMSDSFEGPQRKMLMFRGLQVPIALAGCARAVASAISLVPAQQGEYVRANCPVAKPMFSARRVAGAPMEMVALAVVLELRAEKGNFAAEPLHRAVIDALLAAR